jgi:hypothetical protein
MYDREKIYDFEKMLDLENCRSEKKWGGGICAMGNGLSGGSLYPGVISGWGRKCWT